VLGQYPKQHPTRSSNQCPACVLTIDTSHSCSPSTPLAPYVHAHHQGSACALTIDTSCACLPSAPCMHTHPQHPSVHRPLRLSLLTLVCFSSYTLHVLFHKFMLLIASAMNIPSCYGCCCPINIIIAVAAT
jgi:hypothetical protein